ncbi:dna repair protein rad14 [Nannochloropsis gaditana]|uniref:Dna repair protein rad14 n=1 Tax=Nannochloropsis gaditana TaxID=72520 RepID=W7TQF6_9STRA|nr:dna repair protein rad14 [Nannochloropsis gaditana]
MLTDEQRARIEENRKRALALRARKEKERLQQHAELLREQQLQLTAADTNTPESSSQALQNLLAQGGFTREGPEDEGDSTDSVPTAAPSAPVPKATQVEGKGLSCEVCGSGLVDPMYHDVFRITVCTPCKNNNEEEYGLVTKGDAVAEFLLQEGTMRVMPYLERNNPRNTKYQKMKLYCRRLLRAKAYERWDGPEGLAEERNRRRERRYESAIDKTLNVFAKTTKKAKIWSQK